MSSTDVNPSEISKWDPGLTERVMGVTRPILNRYFRSEVRGLDNMPPKAGGDDLTVQVNLIPIQKLGEIATMPHEKPVAPGEALAASQPVTN